jgi:hypothetical protein
VVPSYNKLTGILDAWSPENPNGKVPIISTSDANGNFNASDFYIENGSYLRIRNVTLGYTYQNQLQTNLRWATYAFMQRPTTYLPLRNIQVLTQKLEWITMVLTWGVTHKPEALLLV